MRYCAGCTFVSKFDDQIWVLTGLSNQGKWAAIRINGPNEWRDRSSAFVTDGLDYPNWDVYDPR